MEIERKRLLRAGGSKQAVHLSVDITTAGLPPEGEDHPDRERIILVVRARYPGDQTDVMRKRHMGEYASFKRIVYAAAKAIGVPDVGSERSSTSEWQLNSSFRTVERSVLIWTRDVDQGTTETTADVWLGALPLEDIGAVREEIMVFHFAARRTNARVIVGIFRGDIDVLSDRLVDEEAGPFGSAERCFMGVHIVERGAEVGFAQQGGGVT